MEMKTRTIAAIGALALSTLFFAGCGGAEPGAAESSSDSVNNASASVWALNGGFHEVMWKDSFARWNADNPENQIDLEFFANDSYKEKIRTAIGSDNAPTLIYGWGGATLRDYAETGKIVDLTDDLGGELERVIPTIAEGGKVDGKLYAIPHTGSQPVVLYYNKKLFNEAGIEAPKTWNELLKAVDVFKERGVIPISLAGASKWTSMMWLEYLFDRIGGPDVFNRIVENEKGAWSDPAVKKSLEYAQELVKAGAFGDGFGSVSSDADADAALLYTGKAAMLLQGAWTYGRFVTDAPEFLESGDLGYTVFPLVESGKGGINGVVGNLTNYWSISTGAPKEAQETAKKYLRTVLEDEYLQKMVEGGDIPNTVNSDAFIEGSPQKEFTSFGYDIVKNSTSYQLSWDQDLPSATSQVLLDQIQMLFNLSVTPDQFIETMNATIK